MPPYLPPEHRANDLDYSEVEGVPETVGWKLTKPQENERGPDRVRVETASAGNGGIATSTIHEILRRGGETSNCQRLAD
jgi:hypothetical protein